MVFIYDVLVRVVILTLIEELVNEKRAVMSDQKEKHDECKMTQTDSEGNTDLCCCYILDEDGRLQDPCHLPVDDYCCR